MSGIGISEKTVKKMNNGANIVSDFAELMKKFSDEFADRKNKSATEDFNVELLENKARQIKEHKFKIVVCGKFKNGKSTFTNALLQKETMAAKATACTAVVAVVSKGSHENQVTVVYNDGTRKKLSLDDYTREFQLTDEEQDKIDMAGENDEEIVFDRFATIDHVEMESMNPMFESGCSLVDTPGLEEALSRDKTTNQYIPQADAIIFMLNATSLFSKAESEFISKNFAGKNKDNVFFVVNRVNQLQEGELERNVMPSVKKHLYSCFTDERGRFNEELYHKRVFYVNAYGALCAKTGKNEKAFLGGRWLEFPVDIESTGMPLYEKTQNEFINSEEKYDAMLTSAMSLMANQLRQAETTVQSKLNAMSMSDSERKEAARKARESLKKAEETVVKIEEAFSRFGKLASDAMFLDLMNYFERNIKGEFLAHVQNEITARHYSATAQLLDAFWATIAMLPSAALRDKAQKEGIKHMQPIYDDISDFISSKMRIWQTQSGACVKSYANDLSAELNDLCDEFDTHIEASVKAFSGGTKNREFTAKGSIQTAIALLLGKDISAVVDISNSDSGISWGALAGKYMGQLLIDSILLSIAPGAIVLKFVIDGIMIFAKAGKAAKARALSLGEFLIDKYKEELQNNELQFKQSIRNNIENTKSNVSDPAKKMLDTEKKKVEQLANEHKRSEKEETAVREKMQKITSDMHEKIDEMFVNVYSRKPTSNEFKNLGANT